VLLALGRRSNLPVVKVFCVGYIEFDPRRAVDHAALYGR
jgi:hypothetical protein